MGTAGLRWRDPSYISKVVDVRHLRDHVLWLRFDDGLEGEVDLADGLRGEIFEPIRDPAAFAQVLADARGKIRRGGAPPKTVVSYSITCFAVDALE